MSIDNKSVKYIAQTAGAVHYSTERDILTDAAAKKMAYIAQHRLKHIIKDMKQYTLHGYRNKCTVDDLQLAFNKNQINKVYGSYNTNYNTMNLNAREKIYFTNDKILHLNDKMYLESVFYHGFIISPISNIVEYIMKNMD